MQMASLVRLSQPWSVRHRATVAGLALFAFSGIGSPVTAAPILIDGFTSKDPTRIPVFPQSVNVDNAGSVSGTESGLAGTVGGVRSSSLGVATMDVDGFDSAAITVYNTVPFSFFDYNSTTGANATTALLYGSGGALNLNATGQLFLTIDLMSYDAPSGLNLVIEGTVSSSAGGGSFSLPSALVNTPGAQSINLSLAALSAATLADFDTITVRFVAPKSADFRLDTLSLTPEPSTAGALVIGALSSFLRRRRRAARG
jgi:hypothetical protein